MTHTSLNRTERITVRLRPHERELLDKAAWQSKERLAEYTRRVLLASVRPQSRRCTED